MISSCSSLYVILLLLSLLHLQAMGDNRAMEYMRGRRTLEVNPDHPVISSLKGRFDEHGDSDTNAQAMTELLYETSLLTSGFSVDSPKDFAKRCAAFASCFLPSAFWCFGITTGPCSDEPWLYMSCLQIFCSHCFMLRTTSRLCMLKCLNEYQDCKWM